MKENNNMLIDKKRIQSSRLLYELSNYVVFDIPLTFRELPTSSTMANSRKHIFNSFKKIILIYYVTQNKIVILYLSKNCCCNVCRKCDR